MEKQSWTCKNRIEYPLGILSSSLTNDIHFFITLTNGVLRWEISKRDNELSKSRTASDAFLNTSSGKIHGPAEKLCVFIKLYLTRSI